jgi:hypothetical protein
MTTVTADAITLGTAYRLNEAQSLLLCMKADTPVAADVRSEIIAAILALHHVRTVPPMPTTATILRMFDARQAA